MHTAIIYISNSQSDLKNFSENLAVREVVLPAFTLRRNVCLRYLTVLQRTNCSIAKENG